MSRFLKDGIGSESPSLRDFVAVVALVAVVSIVLTVTLFRISVRGLYWYNFLALTHSIMLYLLSVRTLFVLLQPMWIPRLNDAPMYINLKSPLMNSMGNV